jgi:hypothetical protein
VLAVLFALSVALLGGNLLDDAFIHLRYALNLKRGFGIAFNANQPGLGTSSLLYVLLIDQLGTFVPVQSWPWIAKVLSVAGCLGATVVLASQIVRRGRRASAQWVAALACTMLFLTPASARWLQDGMETSLGVLACLLAGVFVTSERQPKSAWGNLLLGLLLSIPACLRVDLLPVSICAGFILYLRSPRRLWLATLVVPVLGWLLSLMIVHGGVIPDTALAKRSGVPSFGWLLGFGRTMGLVDPIWLMGLALALGSAIWKLLLRGRPHREAEAIAFLPLLSMMGAGAFLGQGLEGPRYFLPPAAFLFGVATERTADLLATLGRAPRRARIGIACVVLLSALHFAIIGRRAVREVRSQEFNLLPEVSQATAIGAYDVGRVGWYTGLPVLDFAGLVNGVRAAKVHNPFKRYCDGVSKLGAPQLLVLNEWQVPILSPTLGEGPSFTCGNSTYRYSPTERVVMSQQHLFGSSQWKLWRLSPLVADRPSGAQLLRAE